MRHLLTGEEHADDGAPRVASATDVHVALRSLSPRQRACVVLRYFDDLTVPAISRELGIAEGTVKRYLSDALDSLAAVLGPLEDADDGETWEVSLRDRRPGRKR